MSPSNYARALTKVSIGQILQAVGFQSAHSTALDILVEVLERYVGMISQSTHDYAELANRTEPNLDDLSCAFERHRVTLSELEEYINWVDTPEYRLSKHVVESNSIVARPKKPGYCDDEKSREKELKERESDEEWEHVYDYMPLMTRPQTTTNIDELNQKDEANINDMSIISSNLADMSTTNAPATANGFKEEPAASVIEKNGVKYSNYTWKSMFEPKHTSSRGSVIINRRISQIGAAPMDDFNRSISSREPFSASAKLPNNFQRPKSKYKKSIYNNAVSIYNKSISSTSGMQPLEEIIDEEKLLKQSMSQPILEPSDTTSQAAENIEPNVIIPSAVEAVTTPIVDTAVSETATSASGSTQQKSKVDEMLEAYLTKYSAPSTSSTSTAAAAAATPSQPIKLKLVQSTSVLDESAAKKEPTVPKLKISGLFGPSAEAKSKGTDFSIDEFSTTSVNGNQESRLASNDHFDDNAMDGDYMIKTSSKTALADEHLIWKPITTKASSPPASSLSVQSPPPRQPAATTTATTFKPTLVDYSSNSMESSNVDSIMAASNHPPDTTSQDQQPPIEQTKPVGDVAVTTSSSSKHKKKKKNKDKDKDKDKNKEGKEGGEKSKEKKDKDKDKKHHHHHHHKKKDKEKHKQPSGDNGTTATPLSPTSSKKKEKKLKKLLKKEQKKLSKNAGNAASESTLIGADVTENNTNSNVPGEEETSNTTMNESTTIKTPQISIKISKSSLEPPPPPINDEEAISRPTSRPPDEIKRENMDSTSSKTPMQPPLPKLKLKISSSSSSSSNDPSKPTSSSKPAVSIDQGPNIVKPLKISLGKAPPPNEESAPKASREGETNNEEDEIELGEVVKPKPAKIIPTSSQTVSDKSQQKHSSATAANIPGFNPNQQQLQQKTKLAMKPLVKPNQAQSTPNNNNNPPLRREPSTSNQPPQQSNPNKAAQNKPRQSPQQQQQQRQSPTDIDAATALLLNTQVDLQITPDLATNLANLAAADPTNASSILTSLPLLLALQAHNQAALNRLNSLTGTNGSGEGESAAAASTAFLPSPIAPQSQKKPASAPIHPSPAQNRPQNKTSNPNQQRLSPGETPTNQMVNMKKRKQLDSISGEMPSRINTEGSYHSTPTSSGLPKNPNNNSNSGNNGSSLNRPKVKQMRREFSEGLPQHFFPPMESIARSSKESIETGSSGVLIGGGGGESSMLGDESINFESYESSQEYLWHQQRIKQEELQLQEQLEQLKASRGGNATPKAPGSNNTQKRPSLPDSSNPSSSKPTSSSKLPPANVPPLNLNKPQKKQQLSDMETIFTPVITPVVKSRISPLSQQQQQQQQHHQEAIIDIMSVDNTNTRANMMLMSQKSGGGGTSSNKSRPKSSSISPNVNVESKPGGGGGSTMTIIGTTVECTDVVSNQLWICPTCNKPDDSVPMIGCDSCDDWYHWHCIGITKEPPKNQNWYCHKCGSKTKSGGAVETVAVSGDIPTSSKVDEPKKERTNESLDNTATTTASSPNDSGSFDSFSSLIGGQSFLSSGPTGFDYLSSLKKKKKKP